MRCGVFIAGGAKEAPRGLDVQLAPPGPPLALLPLRRRFRLFDRVLVEVSLRANVSRYRVPSPLLKLVWTIEDVGGGGGGGGGAEADAVAG